MRTTINLEDGLLRALKKEAERSSSSLTATVNRVLRLGIERLHPQNGPPTYQVKTFSMGFPPGANLDKALQLATELEDAETLRKQQLRK